MNIQLINQALLSDDIMKTHALAMNEFLKDLTPWEFGAWKVDNTEKPNMKIIITTQNRRKNASGYHTVEDGIPVSYCLPGTSLNQFGFYRAPRPARTLANGTVRQAVAEYFRAGTITTILHELAEALGDPLIETYSPKEANKEGKRYLREIADPVEGNYYMKVINGAQCIFPDIALPAWFDDRMTTGPWCLSGKVKKAFQLGTTGRAYYMSTDNKFTKA